MRHPPAENEHVPWHESIFALLDVEHDLSLEQVNGHWPVCVMRWQRAPCGKRDQRQTQGPVLHERSRTPPARPQQILVYRLSIVRQMMDQDVSIDRTSQRRHDSSLIGEPDVIPPAPTYTAAGKS
jgi:hypothetical protein